MRGLSPNWLLGTETLHLYIRRRIFFVKILENNNKSNNLEENLILVETIPIKEYTYNRLVVSFGGKLWII
jgi:hypothetical protein